MNSSSKPGVVYVLPNYDPDTGSHFFHIYELISRAAEALDIYLIVERSPKKADQLSIPGYIQKFSFPPLRFGELFFVLAKERLAGRRFFYTHYSFYGALASWLVTRLFGGRAYYWNCGLPWLYPRFLIEEGVFRFALRHTILVTGTAGLAEEYAFRYGLDSNRIRVMPNWINLSRFENYSDLKHFRERLKIPVGAKIVLFVHRLSRRKGSHLLPEIIRQVTEKDKNVMFLIVGDGPKRKNLKLEIRNWKLEQYVRLVGEIPQREIPKYFKAADIFLMPSEEEGFPHVLLEAMAAGVPYVASNVGGVREITPPELRRCIVSESDQFPERVIELLNLSFAEREKLVNAEREWMKQYDIQKVLPKFIALFVESLKSNL